MALENKYYRDNLEEILKYTGGKHLLSIQDVKGFTGISDPRTVRKYYPMTPDGHISADTFARCLCGTEAVR